MWTMKYNVSVVLNDTVVISDFQQHYLVSLFLSCLYMVFLFPVGLIGNILILVVNLDHRGGMTAPDLYFVNLAVADLSLVADSLIEVFNLRRGYYERVVLCTLMNLFQQANMYSSVFFLTWMSFDRFVALTSSAGCSLPHAHLACCAIWLLACSLTAIPFTVAQAQHAGEGRFCFVSMSQVLWLEVTLGFIVPFCMLAACYWRIAETLCRSQRGPAGGQWRPQRQKALRMITAAVVVFFLCWLPENMFVSIDLLRGDGLGGRLRQEYPQTAHAVRLAAFSNSCLNPLIYSFLGGTFQRKLKLFLHQKAGWTKCKHSTSGKSIHQSVTCSHNQAMCNRFNLDVLPQTPIRQNHCRTTMVHTDIR